MAEARVVKVVPNRDLHIAEALVWRDGIRIALELHANGSSQRHYLDYRAAMRFAIDLQAPPELPYILEDGFPLWYGYQRDGIMEVRLTGGDEARPRGTVICT